MSRKSVEVDRKALVAAIKKVEGENGIDGGLSKLAIMVADEYNKVSFDNPITNSVVALRIRQWKLEVKTKAKKRGRGKMTAEQKKAMAAGRSSVNRVSKADKFKASKEAQQSLAILKQRTPERFHGLVEKVASGSRTAATKLLCLDCSGFQTSEVKNCVCPHCPLFLFRPYQGKLDSEEQSEMDGDSVEVDNDVEEEAA